MQRSSPLAASRITNNWASGSEPTLVCSICRIFTIFIYCERSELSGLFNGTDFLYNYFRPSVRLAVNVPNVSTCICHNVAVEPHLQPLTGETLHGASSITQDGARLDVAAGGFWGNRFERAFFDVKVFNPYARSNQRSTLAATYRSHENSKKRAYDQRIREVEHGTFAPLVFSCTGGMGRAATATYRRLAALISTKRDEPYSTTMGWIQCRLSFSLRASIMCLRGARSSVGHLSRQLEAPINLISSEGRVPQLV